MFEMPKGGTRITGYRIGWNYRPTAGSRFVGTRQMVSRFNRVLIGWSNYFYWGAGQSCLLQGGAIRERPAAKVALSEAQGEDWEIRTFLRRQTTS